MSRPRPFGPVDVAILATFAAGALVSAATADANFRRSAPADRRDGLTPEHIARRPDWLWSLEGPARRAVDDLQAFLVVATVGLGTASIRRPGLFNGRRWPGPGIMAGAVGSLVVAYSLAIGLLYFVPGTPGTLFSRIWRTRFFTTFLVLAVQGVPSAILGAWTLSAISRRWRPRTDDWDDRLGRLLGWSWLGLYGYIILYPAIWT